MTSLVASPPSPPDFGSDPGVRSRIREYRLGLLRRVLLDAGGPLRFEDVFERLRAIDGAGIPLRTLKEPPFAELISAQTARRGSPGALTGLPWRLRRLDDDRLAARDAELRERLHAMRIDLPGLTGDDDDSGRVDGDARPVDDLRARIERVFAMETAIRRSGEEHGRAIASAMKSRLIERREEVAARRQEALSLAYRQLLRPVPAGPNG